VQLDRTENGTFAARPAGWVVGEDFYVAVAAGAQVWVWHEKAAPDTASGWLDFGEPGSGLDSAERIVDLALVPANNALFALRGERLFWHALAGEDQWRPAPLDPQLSIAALSPVGMTEGANTALALLRPALCAIDDVGGAWLILLNPNSSVLACLAVPELTKLSSLIRPLALFDERPDHKVRLRLVAASADAASLLVFTSDPFDFSASAELLASTAPIALEVGAQVIGRDLDIETVNGEITIAAATTDAVRIATPFVPHPALDMEALTIQAEDGTAGGAPVFIDGGHVVVPGTRSDALVGTLALPGRLRINLTADNF
ncbi:MAG: hypothetical protein ABIT83_18635, partial [Massilia sp.]